MTGLRSAGVAIAVLAAWRGAPRAEAPLAIPVAVRVVFSEGEGSLALAEDAEAAIAAELRRGGCFASARETGRDTPDPSGVALVVALEGVREEIRHDESLAAQSGPLGTESARRHSVVVDMGVAVNLRVPRTEATVIEDRFHVRVERTPRVAGDDARSGAWADALAELGRKVRKAVCRGGATKLRKRIDDASRGEPAVAP